MHHPDHGVQYVASAYTTLQQEHQAVINMGRKGNPNDNAACESFRKTLKYEEVYRNEYRDFHEARSRIGEFWSRLQSEAIALGSLPPAEFEKGAAE